SWDASTDDTGVTGYRVYRQNADGTWPASATASTDASTRSLTDKSLTDGASYTYRVTAVDGAGNESAPSATASATPQAPPPPSNDATAASSSSSTRTEPTPVGWRIAGRRRAR